MTAYHIDTDMGVDDGLALVHAHHLLGERIAAVSTVFGNVPQTQALANALLFRRLLAPPARFPVFHGAGRASDGTASFATAVHGHDGLGGASQRLAIAAPGDGGHTATGSLQELADSTAGSGGICIIGLGPATNIPRLVAAYGADRIERIVLMSGVFLDIGNVTPVAEFNAYADPGALRATLALGVPVTFVPLDLCRKVQLARATVAAYQPRSSPLTELVVDSHMAYMDYYNAWEGIDGCFPHDTVAVFVAVRSDWFTLLPAAVAVDTEGELRGRTTMTPCEGSHVSIATGGELINVRKALQNWP